MPVKNADTGTVDRSAVRLIEFRSRLQRRLRTDPRHDRLFIRLVALEIFKNHGWIPHPQQAFAELVQIRSSDISRISRNARICLHVMTRGIDGRLDSPTDALKAEMPWRALAEVADQISGGFADLTPDLFASAYGLMQADRHGQGVYYTPPSESRFMCVQALALYLRNRCDGLTLKQLTGLLESAAPPDDANVRGQLMRALSDVVICDPAMGTGELLSCMLVVIRDGMVALGSPADARLPACRRMHGCDIDPAAVEIARLRLWLGSCPDREPAAEIPGLDENLRAGDSLMGVGDRSIRWAGDFRAIFDRPDPGFDIVISNPPYVRQELIPDALTHAQAGYTKADLLRTYRELHGPVVTGQSDLYAYFFPLGHSILRTDGVLALLTSNSWLDVEYGTGIQALLIAKFTSVTISESVERRSFSAADVNTAMAVAQKSGSGNRARCGIRFVAIRAPFSEINAGTAVAVLYDQVVDRTAVTEIGNDGRTEAIKPGKWGAQYLRAPKGWSGIYDRIRASTVSLNTIASIRRGVTTGANDFFFVTADRARQWGIEEQFLKPVVRSLKEVAGYELGPERAAFRLFSCRMSMDELAARGKTGALAYIEQGMAGSLHTRSTVRVRQRWYSLPDVAPIDFVSNRFLGERFGFPCAGSVIAGDAFFTGSFYGIDPFTGCALLNSTLTYLSAEVFSRKTYGIGVAYIYGPEVGMLLLPDPSLFDEGQVREIRAAFRSMCGRRMLRIGQELEQPDRAALDSPVFDVLGVDRHAVYDALLGSVEQRIRRAHTFDTRMTGNEGLEIPVS